MFNLQFRKGFLYSFTTFCIHCIMPEIKQTRPLTFWNDWNGKYLFYRNVRWGGRRMLSFQKLTSCPVIRSHRWPSGNRRPPWSLHHCDRRANWTSAIEENSPNVQVFCFQNTSNLSHRMIPDQLQRCHWFWNDFVVHQDMAFCFQGVPWGPYSSKETSIKRALCVISIVVDLPWHF